MSHARHRGPESEMGEAKQKDMYKFLGNHPEEAKKERVDTKRGR